MVGLPNGRRPEAIRIVIYLVERLDVNSLLLDRANFLSSMTRCGCGTGSCLGHCRSQCYPGPHGRSGCAPLFGGFKCAGFSRCCASARFWPDRTVVGARTEMRVKVAVGDVFLIPLDDESAAGGYVIGIRDKEELYVAIFDQRLSRQENDPSIATGGAPVILTLTLDAKIWHRHWPVLGNLPSRSELHPKPNYKVKFKDQMCLDSYDGTIVRPASAEELEILQFRRVNSPAAVENATKACFGIGDWMEHYDKMLTKHAVASSKLTGSERAM